MARRRLSHLGTRGGVFWIRIAVPRDLCTRLHRREWKFSLRTREPHIAKLRCLEATLAIERLQTMVRAMPTLTDAQITDTAKAYLEWALKHAVDGARAMAAGPLALQTRDYGEVDAQSVQQLADGTPDHERNALTDGLNRLRSDLAACRLDWAAKPLAADFARSQGIEIDRLDSDSEAALLHALQRARIEEYRIRLAQLDGNYADAVVRDPLFEDMRLPLRVDWTQRSKPRADVPTLGAAVERYKQSRNNAGAWVGKTLKDNKRVLNWFMELSDPSMSLTAVTAADIRAYIDALDDLPSNVIKLKEFAAKPLPQILVMSRSRQGDERLGQATKAKYFSKLKAFFTWCEEQGYGTSPVGKLTVPEPRNVKEQRLPFNRDQLNLFFTSPQYSGHASPQRRAKPGNFIVRDGKFWIPLIGLYSGMRLGEIVQLFVADVREVDGVWCFDVSRAEEYTQGPQKNIKTASSVRLVPVHPALLDIGFLAFLTELRHRESKRLFPDIAPGRDGYYSHNFSKYFSRYLVHIGIKTKKTSFHSFRHNFGEACDRGDVQHLIREALMGHADDSTAGRYGSARYPTELLLENLKRTKFDVDLSRLADAKTK